MAQVKDGDAAVVNAKRMYSQPEASPDLKHRLVAVAPDQRWVATALGTKLSIVTATGGQVTVAPESCHTECIQVLVSSADGKLLLSAGDDKHTKLWDTDTWTCIKTVTAAKKVSAACFSHDGQHFLVGDKFGDVGVSRAHADGALEPFLGHFCAIITSLCADPQGRWLASGDRDGKLRVSRYPAEPTKGAWEICAYCMGHAACITWIGRLTVGSQYVLVSAGVDGQLIAWDAASGTLLSRLQLTKPAEEGAPTAPAAAPAAAAEPGGAAAGAAAPTTDVGSSAAAEPAAGPGPDVDRTAANDGDAANADGPSPNPKVQALVACAVNPDSGVVAVAIEGRDELTLVHCCARSGGEGVDLRVTGAHSVGGVTLPTRLTFGQDGLLWAVGGPCSDTAASVHVGTCRFADDGAQAEQVPLPTAFAALDTRDPAEDAAAAAETPRSTQMKPWQRKKWTAEAIAESKADRAAKKKKNDEAQEVRKAKQAKTDQESQATA